MKQDVCYATGKIRYVDEHAARVELVGAIVQHNLGRLKRKERRAYLCHVCGGWHLTSQATPPKKKVSGSS